MSISAPPVDGQQRVDLHIDVSAEDRQRLLNRRFEMMLFVDHVFLVEDERAVMPFSYSMNTGGLAPGRHVLTVNVVDVDGNLGTRNILFEVTSGHRP